MTDEMTMVAAVVAEPRLDAPRAALADWLAAHGQPERADVIRLRWPRRKPEPRPFADVLAEREGPVTAVAGRLEAEGLAGIEEFARRQLAVEAYEGPRTARYQARIDWVYAALLASWRRWLPPAVTTLTRLADREAYNQDYFSPAVKFPTRRRPPRAFAFREPGMTVLFAWGLPEWVRCDPEDWDRAGPALVRRFPWVEYEPEED